MFYASSNFDAVPGQPYPELRAVLETFVRELMNLLADNLVGVYLVGSLASGDFDLDSDVDFLVVTKEELTESTVRLLRDIHVRLHNLGNYPAEHLEGSYITLADLRDWSMVGKKELLYLDNGSTTFERATHDNKWHVRWILRERGLALFGPAPASMLPPIPVDEMRSEVRMTMRDCLAGFADAMDQPLSFWNSRFGQSFFVLSFCRMLHTLHTGTVQSKLAGAQWAEQIVEPRWIGFIQQAWAEREGVRFMEKIRQRADTGLLRETLDFMNYIYSLSS